MVYVAITTVTSERFHHPQIGLRAPISSCSPSHTPPTHTVHPNSDQPPWMADLCFCNHIASNHSCLASFTRLKALVGHLPCSVYRSFIPWYYQTAPHREDIPYILLSIHHLESTCAVFPLGKFKKAAVNISAHTLSFTHVFFVAICFVLRQGSPGYPEAAQAGLKPLILLPLPTYLMLRL